MIYSWTRKCDKLRRVGTECSCCKFNLAWPYVKLLGVAGLSFILPPRLTIQEKLLHDQVLVDEKWHLKLLLMTEPQVRTKLGDTMHFSLS